MYELSKQFRFEAAHTLVRTIGAETSRRIHGHSYRAEVTLRGEPEASSGMLIDLGYFTQLLDGAREGLDHQFLDEISDLGQGTLENLCAWIWRKIAPSLEAYPHLQLACVTVYRDSEGDTCRYYG